MTPPDAIASALKTAERYTDRNPSDAAKEAGNYQKGKFNWNGETISVENPKGSTRSGTDKGGKRWEVTLPATYGYILGTEAVDSDHVDCYVGDDHASKTVWVIDQVDENTKRYDEPKCMLSFKSKEAALSAYEKAFSDGRAKDRIGSVTEMSIPEFRAWANSSAAKKPLAKGYASGGSVMPLIKSGSKAAISSNIKEMSKTHPHDQAVAAALETARRYANGGTVGMAGGGDALKALMRMLFARGAGTATAPSISQEALAAARRFESTFGHPPPKDMPVDAMERWIAGKSEHFPSAPRAAAEQSFPSQLPSDVTLPPQVERMNQQTDRLRDAMRSFEQAQPPPNPNILHANGGRIGYEDGGMTPREVAPLPLPKSHDLDTSDVLGRMPKEPEQHWMFGKHSPMEALKFLYENTRDDPSLPASMTGLPSVARGVERAQEPGIGNKVAGAGEALSGALPMLSGTRVAAPLFSSMPRTFGTYAVPQAMQDAGDGKFRDFLDALLPKARAEDAASVPLGPALMSLPSMPAEPKPFAGEMRKPAEVRVIQQQLKDAGYNVDVDGKDKEGTRRAELDFNQKEYDKSLKRIQEIQGINAAAQEAWAKTQGANASMAETKRKEAEGDKASKDETTRKADFDRLSGTLNPVTEGVRLAAPYAALGLGAWGGYAAGNKMAKTFRADAEAERDAANALVKKTTIPEKGLNKAVGNANKFSQEGQTPPVVNPFVEPEKVKGGRRGPFWEWNSKAPPSSELYPEPSKLGRWPEHATAAAKIGAVGAADILPSWHYANMAEAEKNSAYEEFKKHPSPATLDAWEGAKTKEAIAMSLMRLGQGFTPAALGSASYGIHQRPNMRPDVQRYDELAGNIRERLQGQKDVVAAVASQKSKRAKQAKEKEGSPNGAATHANGKLPVLPIATGLGLGALPELRSVSRDGSSALSSPDESPYADGGSVEHHSNYQPRYKIGDRRGKFKAGGPIWPSSNPNSDKPKEGLTPKSGLSGAISRALDSARKFARGGKVTVGAIQGPTGGRADALPISVPAGAFVIPSDCVSGMPNAGGNTEAGMRELDKIFGKPKARADGGSVPIKISHGEYVLDPEQVARIGGGDMDRGHQMLDDFVRRIRADHVRTLSALPGPAR